MSNKERELKDLDSRQEYNRSMAAWKPFEEFVNLREKMSTGVLQKVSNNKNRKIITILFFFVSPLSSVFYVVTSCSQSPFLTFFSDFYPYFNLKYRQILVNQFLIYVHTYIYFDRIISFYCEVPNYSFGKNLFEIN